MRQWQKRSVLTSGALVLLSCGGPPDTVRPVPVTQQVYYNDDPIFTEPIERVVYDLSTWRQLWDDVVAAQPTATEMPPVDFGRHMLVVVGGGRMDAGDRVQVDSVGLRNEQLVVFYTLIEDCGEFASNAYPLQVVRTDREDEPVRFISQRELAPQCRGDESG